MANLFKNIEDLQSVVGVANGASLNAILVKETDAYNLFLKKYYTARIVHGVGCRGIIFEPDKHIGTLYL